MYRFVFVLIYISFGFYACRPPQKYYKHMGAAEGTTFHITYQSSQCYNAQIDSLLNHFEDVLSTYRPHSVISRFNQSQTGMAIHDSLFWNMFETAQRINQITDGAFDITVAPLVNAWGFGFTDTLQVDSLHIDSLLQWVGMHHLSIHGDTLLKDNPHVQLDANAIAKGQSVDYISHFFEARGIDNFMVEIGGEVRAKGVNATGVSWRIGIDKPIDHNNPLQPELQAVMSLKNKAVATSGNYRRFYEKNGVRYSHTINPKTGYPVRHSLLSASVLASNCMTADAFATAFMVLGVERGKHLLQNHLPIDVFFVYDHHKTFQVYETNGFKKWITK